MYIFARNKTQLVVLQKTIEQIARYNLTKENLSYHKE